MLKKLSLSIMFSATIFCSNFAVAAEPAAGEYNKCLRETQEQTDDAYVPCVSAEVKRLEKAINKQFELFLKDPRFVKWNNGNGLFRGNIKDMNDRWIAFRNNYCAFYNMAMYRYTVSKNYNREKCMMDLSQDYLDRLRAVYHDYDAADVGPGN